jgi:hypothetical protein
MLNIDQDTAVGSIYLSIKWALLGKCFPVLEELCSPLNPPGGSGADYKKGDFFRPNRRTGEGEHRTGECNKRRGRVEEKDRGP